MKKKITSLLVAILILLVGAIFANNPEMQDVLTEWLQSLQSETTVTSGQLLVHIIDVGQGDAILIQGPSGENMLIDGGERSTETTEQLIRYLRAKGVKKIHVLVATHPHSDHIGGLPTVMKTFPIGAVYDSGKPATSNIYATFLNVVEEKKIPYYLARRGKKIKFADGLDLQVLNPTGDVDGENVNNASIVLRLTYGKISFLLTGDAESEVENELVKGGYNVQADILKVGHHGSDSSTSAAFLDKVKPTYALISVGEGNSYGHPHKRAMDKLKKRQIQTYMTKDQGNILVVTDGDTVSVKRSKK
jgi:DNA internalization-related competence protein ComEC/Rec2